MQNVNSRNAARHWKLYQKSHSFPNSFHASQRMCPHDAEKTQQGMAFFQWEMDGQYDVDTVSNRRRFELAFLTAFMGLLGKKFTYKQLMCPNSPMILICLSIDYVCERLQTMEVKILKTKQTKVTAYTNTQYLAVSFCPWLLLDPSLLSDGKVSPVSKFRVLKHVDGGRILR